MTATQQINLADVKAAPRPAASTAAVAEAPPTTDVRPASKLQRAAVFAYGMTCYAIGVAGLNYMILVTLGMLPFTGGGIALESTSAKMALNLGLIAVFGVQHAIMAREGFKRRWTKIIPAAAERSTFTMIAGLLVASILFFFQPMEGALWSVESTALRYGLTGLCAAGWVYMLTASFAIDHFELFGVKQVWRNLRGLDTQEPKLVQRMMYKFDRHPLMTGVAVGLWSTPDMSFTRFVLAIGFSVYIVLGVAIEERDLIRRHGSRYIEFARRVRTIVPRLIRYSR